MNTNINHPKMFILAMKIYDKTFQHIYSIMFISMKYDNKFNISTTPSCVHFFFNSFRKLQFIS